MTQDEQKRYDSIVHGLRSQGWTRIEAEGEALERIEATRTRSATFTTDPIDSVALGAAFLGLTVDLPGDREPKTLGRGTVTILHEDGTEETLKGTWTKVFHP